MKIIERRLPIHHFLVRRIFGEVSAYKSSQAFCQVVYFDEYDPKVITASLVYLQDQESIPDGFENLIEEDLTFDECLIMSTLYFAQPSHLIKQILYGSVKKTEDFLTHILRPTNGYLLYAYQFDQLAQLILNVPLDEAVKIRKVYNKQQSLISYNERDDHQLRQFKAIVQDCAITRVVHKPNYEGAKNLFLYAQTTAWSRT